MLRYINQPTSRNNHSASAEVSRIISAAVVNKHFCSMLLNNPSAAIMQGYSGEPFLLTTEEKQRIAAIKERSLEGFAAQLANL